MTTDEYQEKCHTFRDYENTPKVIYTTLGLTGEAGEVADKVKKMFRDNGGKMDDHLRLEIAKELGDVAWYLAELADDLGFRLSEIFDMNIEKLTDRMARDKLKGSGDNR